MSKYLHPCTLELAYEVASNLRLEDARECIEGHGIVPTYHIPLASLEGFCRIMKTPTGKTAGIVGIHGTKIWMLTTPEVLKHPITFAREAKKWIESLDAPYLCNVVDERNKVHLKLLKYLGFEFHETIAFGPNKLPFIIFSKCAHQ